MLRIALYQPDIPQNVGAAIRLCACMGIALDIIEPCGFPWDIKKIRQSGMDYLDQAQLMRQISIRLYGIKNNNYTKCHSQHFV